MVGRIHLLHSVLVSVLVVLPVSVLGSIGDRSPKFGRCVASCRTDTCRDHRPLPFTDDTIVPSDPLPWYLVLTGWTCESNCEYHCTHRITNEAHKRVQDIRNAVYENLRQEQDTLVLEHQRWRLQQAQKEAGQSLDPACEGEAFANANGECIPLMVAQPPPRMTEKEIRTLAEERIRKELEWLPPIDKQTVQFFGKWAQLRVLGMQEPFSVLFSLLNLAVQVYAYQYILHDLVPTAYPLKETYRRHALVSIVAWIASAIFHTRDLWWTERVDYFAAAAVLVSGLFFTVCRALFAAPDTPLYRRWLVTCIGAWVLHVLYLLSRTRLDYSYNMVACLAVGVVHNLVWLALAFAPQTVCALTAPLASYASCSASKTESGTHDMTGRPRGVSRSQQQRLVLLVGLMFLAPCLELFDFPPLLRLLDAHALWHLSTVPLTLYWYYWLVDDACDCVVAHNWKLDQHVHEPTDATELDESHNSRTSGLPEPNVSPLKAGRGAPLPPAPPPALEEGMEHVRRWLAAGGVWGRDQLRTLRALLISQS